MSSGKWRPFRLGVNMLNDVDRFFFVLAEHIAQNMHTVQALLYAVLAWKRSILPFSVALSLTVTPLTPGINTPVSVKQPLGLWVI